MIRLGILLGYMFLIGADARYSARLRLSRRGAQDDQRLRGGRAARFASVQRHSTLHTRCGTGFLLVVVLLSIVVFVFLGRPPLPLAHPVADRAGAGDRGGRLRIRPLRRGPLRQSPRAPAADTEPGAPAADDARTRGRHGRSGVVAFKRVLVADQLLALEAAGLDATVPVDAAGLPLPPATATPLTTLGD